MALHLAGTDYEHREVLLRDKPEAMLEASPKGSVPVFIVDGTVIDESLDIMRWAMPDADFQTDIIEMIDGPFKHHMDRYKYASRYDPEVKRGDVNLVHRAQAVENLALIENTLAGAAYLHGKDMGPTDMATFPFVRQFAAVQPEWWAANPDLRQTQIWLENCLKSKRFTAVMEKQPQWVPPV
jgi:glutathione S-transferase